MYNHKEIESRWQKFWEENKTFKTVNPIETGLRGERPVSDRKKYYCLDMFPYPSGAGLHVGHPEGYTANDIVARFKHACGYNVLHPMGWDAFGLPAENYAIKTGTHPKITTNKNIETFKKQIKSLGFSYDWEREIDTTDPKYYKWTQWIFLKLFEAGLAYEQDLPINYCPSCKTGLANEEVLNDFTCDRCGTKVEKRQLRQWVLAITKYAERLLHDVDKLDWPEGIKDMQRNWIGKSEGCEFEMKKDDDKNKSIRVYTTRIDTVFGMTYAVLAPDHPQVMDFITSEQKEICLQYIEESKKKSDQDRTADNKEKTGVFTGSYVINPYNDEKVPLWIADYVLGNYGTGAVMAVPAHDERDFEFAKKYNLEIKQSIAESFIGIGGGQEIPQKDKQTNKTAGIAGVIENNKGEILLLNWKKTGRNSFVTGKLNENEDPIDTVLREIKEETGYTDLIIEEGPYIAFVKHYHKGKDYNVEGYVYGFHLKLLSDKREEIKKEEEEKHTFSWYTKEEAEKKINIASHNEIFSYFFKKKEAFTNDGVLVNSKDFDGFTSEEARQKLTEFAEKNGFGTKKINYKLRDWLFSRQRYWGEPIPLIHLQKEEVEKLSRVKFIDKKTPYITLGGKSCPRSDNNIFEFECVSALIQHPEKEEFLVLEFDNGECGLVGGALENGENKDEAIVREIREETGYKNMEIKEIVFEKAYGRGYKERKDREEISIDKIYLIKLKDLSQDKHSGELEQIKNYHWLNKKDCVEKISLHHHKFYAEYYFSKLGEGDYTYIVEKNPPIPNPFPPREKGDGEDKYSSFFEKTPYYITKLSQELRKNPTKTEEIIWEILRGKNLGVKFRRQHPFGRYIADFYSDEQKLVIEIDGGIHESAKQKEYDEIRDEIIQKYSVKILRIKNEEIKNDLENVIQKIITSFSTPFSLGGKGWDRGTSSFLSDSGENARIEEDNCNYAYIVEKLPTYTIIEKSLSPQNVLKLKDFGNLEIEKEDKDRGKFFKLSVSQEKEEELINFLKENLITKTKEEGGNWYADSMRTSNKIIFNGKVFDIQTKKDLVDFKNYGLSVGVPEKELEIDFQEAKSGEYLYIGGKEFSKIYDGLYTKMVCDYTLPLELPEVKDYEPSGDGNSPLAKIESFVNVKLAENLSGKRETNTMPQWGGSCWYYLRYMDPHNENELVNPEVEKYWGQVDSYVGGAEHAVLHLLYARFWHKFLFDIGVVSSDEPFYRLRNQGLILAHAFQRKNGGLVANDLVEEKNGKYYLIETGEELNRIVSKMSKSLKNVVNPDEIVNEYGADALRLYEMYMADFKDAAPWDSKGIVGVSRFLDKVWRLFMEEKRFAESDEESMKTLHKTIKKVGEDIENYKFNTAIAQLMICVNTGLPKDELLQEEWREKFLIILHPFAPHIAEELWKNFTKDKIKQAYLATGNKNKMTRLQMVIEKNKLPLSIHQYQDYQEVEETGNTALENALQKMEPYKAKKRQFPIITTDSGMYFDGIGENPTYVKRNALKFAGLDEKSCSQEQVAEAMSNYYKKLARENGGTLDFHYEDAWVILLSNDTILTHSYKREYTLTDKENGPRDIYFPMRNLYISKITGKYAYEQTEEDTKKEFDCMREMLEKLFSDSIFFASWPEYDEKMTIDDTIKIGVQVNGKLRGDIEIAKDESQSSALQKAKENVDIQKWIEGHEIIKEIYVPGRIVSIIVR